MKGTIIENSLQDKSILDALKIEKTWHAGDWILHDVLVDESQIEKIRESLLDAPWYIHFWEPGQDKVIVIFKNKTFEILHSDKSTWIDAIQYGKSIGIPEEQLDFIVT